MPKTHRDLDDRIARDVIAALKEGPATLERLRQLVRGAHGRQDDVIRMLAAAGRIERIDRQTGWALVEREAR